MMSSFLFAMLTLSSSQKLYLLLRLFFQAVVTVGIMSLWSSFREVLTLVCGFSLSSLALIVYDKSDYHTVSQTCLLENSGSAIPISKYTSEWTNRRSIQFSVGNFNSILYIIPNDINSGKKSMADMALHRTKKC